mmetsp:Transcript_8539/g.23978  ORF Transcript_8539/g.23978 Transcript_8539/m.23978 type:complete len:202 (+) Transcript_8539:832-1437(+)
MSFSAQCAASWQAFTYASECGGTHTTRRSPPKLLPARRSCRGLENFVSVSSGRNGVVALERNDITASATTAVERQAFARPHNFCFWASVSARLRMSGVSPAGVPSTPRARPAKMDTAKGPSPRQWCIRQRRAERSPSASTGMRCTRQSGREWSRSVATSPSISRRASFASATADSATKWYSGSTMVGSQVPSPFANDVKRK